MFDVLVAIGITPDLIIGYSIGEIVCAYADGCLTAEQTIKVAYYYGLATLKSNISLDEIILDDIEYNEIKHISSLNDEMAYHILESQKIISKFKESVEKWIFKLNSKDILTQTINIKNSNYHSKFTEKHFTSLLEYLKKVIPNLKLRSKKWISTSIPEEKLETDAERYCSSEFCAKHLLNSVLLDETLEHVPNESVLIELSPRSVLERLQQSPKMNITTVDLVSKNRVDGLDYLLSALGK